MTLETVNLKTAITFRVLIVDKMEAFSTKVFRGERGGTGLVPEAKAHVPFTVHEILFDLGGRLSWFPLPTPTITTVLWSNVLSVQHEKEVQ